MEFLKQAEKWEQKWAWFCPDKFQNAFNDYIRAGNEFKNIQNNTDSAIDAYKRAESLLPKINYDDDHLRQNIYKCLAEAYNKKGDLETAEKYYLEAARYAEVGRIFNDCGIMFLGHDYSKASKYFELSAQNGYPRNYLNSALALARYYNDYNDDVIKLFRIALDKNPISMKYDSNAKLYSLLSKDYSIINSVYAEFPDTTTLLNDLRYCNDRKTFDHIIQKHRIELLPENDTFQNVMLLRIRNQYKVINNSDSDDIC